MTFDQQIATTLDSYLPAFRDKVAGVTGFSVSYDDAANGTVIFNTPRDDQILVAGHNGTQSGVNISNDDWTVLGFIRQGWGNGGTDTSFTTNGSSREARAPDDDSHGEAYAGSDPCEYWAHYSTEGFGLYVRRTMGDGWDSSWGMFCAMVETEYWDYHTANVIGGGQAAATLVAATGEHNKFQGWAGRYMEGHYGGQGALNPDDNFGDYVWEKPVKKFSPADTETGWSPPCAKFYGVAIDDESGTALQSGDVIQTSGGVDRFMLLAYDNARAALSMK